MLRSLLKGIIISLGLLLFCNNLFANHILGGEITYKFISKDAAENVTYEITLKIYRDPNGSSATFQPTTDLGAFKETSVANKPLIKTFSLDQVSNGQVFASSPFQTSCSVSPDYSIYQVVYKGNVTLPKSALGYHITWGQSARVIGLNNLDYSNGSLGIMYYAFIPSSSIANNSAVFSDIPVTAICVGDTVSILNSAKDADAGDVLKYRFSIPYQGYGTSVDPPIPGNLTFPITDTVPYKAGFSYSKPPGNGPMGPAGYAYTEPFTGVSTFKAPTIGSYVVLVEVSEYRNGVLVGITRRDIVVTAKACGTANRPGPTYSSGGATKTKFYVKAGENICFPFTYTAADVTRDSILVTTTSSIFNPLATPNPATITGPIKDKGTVTQQVCWQTNCSQGSSTPYTIFTSAKDNFCPQIAPVTSTIEVYVLRNKPVISGLNVVCPLQKFVKYTVADTAIGSTFQWSVTGGSLNTTTGDTVRIDWNDPAVKGVITAVEKSRAGCLDTTTFDVNMNRIPVISAGADQQICSYDSTTVLGPPGGAVSGYIYKWTPTQGLSNPNIANPKMSLPNNTGSDIVKTYSLHVSTPEGCYSDDNVAVTIHSRMPVNVVSTPQTVCRNDVASLSATGGVSYKWYLQGNPGVLSTVSPYNVTPTATTTYTVVATDNFGCTNNNDIVVTVNQLPIISAFTIKDSICLGSSTQLIGNGGTFYTWAYLSAPTIILSNSQKFTVSPTTAETYIVEGIDGNNCKNTATIKIFVNPLPNILVQASDDSICPGITTRLNPKNGVSYLWYKSTAPTTPISNDDPYFVSPFVTTTYNITGTDKHGCVNTSQKEVFVFDTPQTKPIKGSPYVCTNSKAVSFIVPGGVSTSTYHWTVDGTASIVSSTQGNDTLKVDFAQADTINITVQETSKQGCIGAVLTYKVIVIVDYTPPRPDGADTLCSADKDMVVYSAPNGNPDFIYLWHHSGLTVLSDDSTSTITVKWNSTGTPAGYICYTQQSRTAVPPCFFKSDTTFVTIYPSPNTGSIKGDTSICKGDKGIIYEVSGFAGSTYLWKITGGKIVGDSTKTFVTVDWDVTGQLSVLETTDKGCVGTLVKRTIVVNPLPVAGPITGTLTICPTNTIGQVYVTSGLPSSKFKWTVIGGTIKNGNGTTSITVDWDFSIKNPSVSVNEISKDSCSGPTINAPKIIQDEAVAKILLTTTNETNDAEIDLSWNKSINANGSANSYSLERRLFGGGAWSPLGAAFIEPNYSDYNVSTHKVVYQYRYSTKDLCNQISVSVPTNNILLGGVSNESSKKSILYWNSYHNWSGGLNRYEIWRKLDDEAEFTYYSNNGKDTNATFVNANDGFKHRYRIKSIENISGRYAWSNDTTLTFEHKIDVPNAYSPNGDGVNDKWEIKDVDVYTNTDVQIFDRWGTLVYSNHNYKNEWDGRSTGGKDLPDGTYYYIIKLGGKQAFGKDSYNGNVTIVR